ncbi:succinate dehydrogenase, cytochrome b556 subunit [Cryptococcus depauperatus CBS 7841]|uniref:Succinate dehydrogenase, cytochrome b556 subunit n=1 Tax=Cryptococcus depauperatus CBS 7841 TaxID=1295531 RepID=A0A1E3IHV1_9TREE|nr:succinate dehydrogenase, cytochrome b556 subunit [Cryptococcus depauperatus CBS 7841]
MQFNIARNLLTRSTTKHATPSVLRSMPGLMLAQRRFASTEPLSEAESVTLLNSQRHCRPTSPHLDIYQPQVTWVLSSLNRITGVALSGTLYLSAIAYLLHPVFPVIDSAHLVQLVHDLPVWLKGGLKFLFAVPFTFHGLNGLRHLSWDIGKGLSIKRVYTTGYAVIAASAISSIYLAFFV